MDPLDVARFWSKVAVGSAQACWEWRAGCVDSGYGEFSAAGQMWRAHRLAYELVRGPIPAGLVLDHLCRNRLCCNPAHLEAVTNAENVRRGESFSTANKTKTHCKHGHPFSAENTIIDRRGHRRCRLCHTAENRRSHAARVSGAL